MKHIILQRAIPAYLATGADGKQHITGSWQSVMERGSGVENGGARLAGPVIFSLSRSRRAKLKKEGPRINQAVRTDIGNSVLCWLATVDPEGTPNVTPKELFSCYGDDRLVVADVASANTVRNIRAHSAVCASFVDVFRERGFKIVGTATIVSPKDADFPTIGTEVLRKAGTAFPIRHIISIKIARISRIWAPSYTLFPDRAEADRMRIAYDAYGVNPRTEPDT